MNAPRTVGHSATTKEAGILRLDNSAGNLGKDTEFSNLNYIAKLSKLDVSRDFDFLYIEKKTLQRKNKIL